MSRMSIDLSLGRISKLLAHVRPYTRPTCHIAGTNGKGSVSALLSDILIASSYRVGRFNSPHLVSIHDCITIDGQPVPPEAYAEARQRVEAADEELALKSTSFELLACTALAVLEEAEVDIAVIEVGMGGRLDASNVISDDCILVSALTAVDLDHQAFLGDTAAKIAREKAAIARKGKPFVLGSQKHPEVEAVVREVVGGVGGVVLPAIVPARRSWDALIDGHPSPVTYFRPADLIELPPQPVEAVVPPYPEPLCAALPLQGEHQISNLGVVLTIVSALVTTHGDSPLRFAEKVTLGAIRYGIRYANWPGRLSLHAVAIRAGSQHSKKPTVELSVLADGAHNPSSSATLSSYINYILAESARNTSSITTTPRTVTLTFLLGLSRSPPKTPMQTLTPLLEITPPLGLRLRLRVGLLRFTTPDGMPWIKSENPSDLKQIVSSLRPYAELWAAEDKRPPEDQITEALKWAAEPSAAEDNLEHLVVIAGSLYLLADFYRILRSAAV